jgi:hypothetical protein
VAVVDTGYPKGVKLICGIAIGFGLAWLFDPQSGSDRRSSLRTRLSELRRSAVPEAPAKDRSAVETTDADVVAASIAATT